MNPAVIKAEELEKKGLVTEALELLYNEAKTNSKEPEILLHMAMIATRNRQYGITSQILSSVVSEKFNYSKMNLDRLPKKTIMFAVLNWFFQNEPEIYSRLSDKGFFPVIVADRLNARIPLPDLSPDNFRNYKYKGISFYDGVMYGAANILEKGIAEIDPQNPADWHVITEHMETMAAYAEYLAKMIDFYKPEKIIYPQGYVFYAFVMRQVAIAKGIPCLALEYTMHVERVLHDEISGISVNKNTVRNMYWKMKDFISGDEATAFKDTFFAAAGNLKHGEHKVPQQTMVLPENPENKKTVMYIGQVGTNSSVLFGIRNFKDQSEVIIAAVKDVIARGERIVIKLHPKEKNGINALGNCRLDYLTMRRLSANPEFAPYLNHPDVIIDKDNLYNTYDLIDKADFCVTVNSQAGLEALLRGKEVILCGTAFYGNMGWTYEAWDKEDLSYFIGKAMEKPRTSSNQPDYEVLKFFYSYLNHSCIRRDMDSYIKLFTKG